MRYSFSCQALRTQILNSSRTVNFFQKGFDLTRLGFHSHWICGVHTAEHTQHMTLVVVCSWYKIWQPIIHINTVLLAADVDVLMDCKLNSTAKCIKHFLMSLMLIQETLRFLWQSHIHYRIFYNVRIIKVTMFHRILLFHSSALKEEAASFSNMLVIFTIFKRCYMRRESHFSLTSLKKLHKQNIGTKKSIV